ncbi:MAG TPA: thioredoxin domain-containing protein [Kofleriaceae bacterium]|nr:thioredoxin domain-containing protein [Kofleriaceae bacterium]
MVTAPLLVGAACERKQTTDTGAIQAADRAPSGPVDTTPLTGVDASKLDEGKKKLFYTLVGSLGSPCGQAQSLRKSVTEETSCKRAPFAAKYVLALVEDEVNEATIRETYTAKYEAKTPPPKLDIGKAPRLGNDDAPVRLVEFYDYGCGGCKAFKPILDKILEEYRDKAAAYFLMYPLGKWPDSRSAAQASLAAAQQGKFREMHAMLFERAPAHNRDAVMGYAKELGLDVEKFKAAYEAAGPQVDLDHAQGEKSGIESTPTLFINDHKFSGPSWRYVGLWIDEEVAVNR